MTKYKMPAVDSSDVIKLDEKVLKEIKDKVLEFAGCSPKCDWCGGDNWTVDESVYTDVVFNLVEDHHVRNIVTAKVIVSCDKCSNSKYFALDKFGYATKGAIE